MIRCRFAPFIFALSLPSSVLAASSVWYGRSFKLSKAMRKVLNCGWRIAAVRRLICSCAFCTGSKSVSGRLRRPARCCRQPPFTTVAPGQRQLVRLMRVAPIANGKEQSYRIVIDEIPAAQPVAQTEQNSAGLKMRMRYVLPLFTYGQGLAPLKNAGSVESVRTTLRWSLAQQNNRQTLCIENRGSQHASSVRFTGRTRAAKAKFPGLMAFSATFWRRKRPVSRAAESLPCHQACICSRN